MKTKILSLLFTLSVLVSFGQQMVYPVKNRATKIGVALGVDKILVQLDTFRLLKLTHYVNAEWKLDTVYQMNWAVREESSGGIGVDSIYWSKVGVSENLVNTNTGNVGIGTTDAVDKLTVEGTVNSSSFKHNDGLTILSDYSTDTTTYAYLRFLPTIGTFRLGTQDTRSQLQSIGKGQFTFSTASNSQRAVFHFGKDDTTNYVDYYMDTTAFYTFFGRKDLGKTNFPWRNLYAEHVYSNGIELVNSTVENFWTEQTGATNNFYNNHSGNVGMGITNPGTKLHVVSGPTAIFGVSSSSGGAGVAGSGYFGLSGVGTAYGLFATKSGTGYAAWFDQGNVGIGISNPTYKCHVVSSGSSLVSTTNGGSSYYGIYGANTGSGGTAILGYGAGIGMSTGVKGIGYYGVAGESGFINGYGGYFQNIQSGGVGLYSYGTAYSGIFMGGNVGIGTSAPSVALDVQLGGITANGDICATKQYDASVKIGNGGADQYPRLLFMKDEGIGGYIDMDNDNTQSLNIANGTSHETAHIKFLIGTVERVRFTSTGKLLIGTTTEDSTLTANGGGSFAGGLKVAKNITSLKNIGGKYITGDSIKSTTKIQVGSSYNSAQIYGENTTGPFTMRFASTYPNQAGTGNQTAAQLDLVHINNTTAYARQILRYNKTASHYEFLQILYGHASTRNFIYVDMYTGGYQMMSGITTADFANTGNMFLASNGGAGAMVGVNHPSSATLTAKLDINSDIVRVRTAKTPASATAAGNAGDICWDANYIYVCTATNTWKRTAIATW